MNTKAKVGHQKVFAGTRAFMRQAGAAVASSWKEAISLIHDAVLAEMMGRRGAANGLGGQMQEPSLIRGVIDTADPSQLILREVPGEK